jgi:hypothetical protein
MIIEDFPRLPTSGKENMPKFRKKSIVIQAVRFSTDGFKTQELSNFLGWSHDDDAYNWLEISTIEGIMRVFPGDWIIRGVKGEFYPCKNDIFLMTYEQIGEI